MSQILDQKFAKLSEQEQELYKLRHTAEHVLHQAVKELFPKIHLAMGPATEDGFYFDFDPSPDGVEPVKISEADFKNIEKQMWKIINKDLPMVRQELSVDEARKLFADNPYKLEWIDLIEERGESVSVYWTGEPGIEGSMVDLCSGPHADSTGAVKAFKLLSVAGAYWHGDENNKMLTRIYATAFGNQDELKEYLHNIEEAKKRDHRKLGPKLDLFTFSELIGGGLPLYTPKGALVRRLLQQHADQLQKQIGYQEVWTPQLTKADLFKVSGHYDKYKDDMFRVVSNYSKEEFFLKPMNCPNHCALFGSKPRSYRDLPIRYSDFANLYRDEKPGELSGLTRLRAFSQDDGHCFCTEDQIEDEFYKVILAVKEALKAFDLDYWIRLSLWDQDNKDKYLGDAQVWETAQNKLKKLLEDKNIDHSVATGEAAIYGPKIDFMAVDSLKREWQISTIQLDLIMAKRFDLKYADKDGTEKHPVMIHRAILGSPERFMGLIIEHYNGALPVWLSPVQAVIIPISDDQIDYASQVEQSLSQSGVRVETWTEASMQKRIRVAEQQKIPYMLVLGAKEQESESVSVRARGQQDLGVQKLSEFTQTINQQINTKATT